MVHITVILTQTQLLQSLTAVNQHTQHIPRFTIQTIAARAMAWSRWTLDATGGKGLRTLIPEK